MNMSKRLIWINLILILVGCNSGKLDEASAKKTVEMWCKQNGFKLLNWKGVIIKSENEQIAKADLNYVEFWMKNPPMEFTFNKSVDDWALIKVDHEKGFIATQGFSDKIGKSVFIKVSEVKKIAEQYEKLSPEERAAREKATQDSIQRILDVGDYKKWNGIYGNLAPDEGNYFNKERIVIEMINMDSILISLFDENQGEKNGKYISLKYTGETYNNYDEGVSLRLFGGDRILLNTKSEGAAFQRGVRKMKEVQEPWGEDRYN